MADIFISYARSDQAFVETLAGAFETAGYSVWWDRKISAGSEFAQDIERELGAAKAVVAVWTEAAIHSNWVKDEAAFARDRGVLVPIQINREPPLGFRQFNTPEFAGWDGDARSPAFAAVIRAVGELVGRAPQATRTLPAWKRIVKRLVKLRSLATTATLVILGVAIFVLYAPPFGSASRRSSAAGAIISDMARGLDASIFTANGGDYLDRQYLDRVLKSLTQSHTDEADALLALLDTGDVRKAIDLLKGRLDAPGLSDPDYLDLNHQIGAIAELAAPAEAVAAYERILARSPRDFFAASRLGRAYLAQNNAPVARRYYALALEIGHADERLVLQTRSYLAFADNLERRVDDAISAYEAIIARAEDIGFEELEISARASLGMAFSQVGRNEDAKQQFLSVLIAQPEMRHLTEKARASSGLAQLARQSGDLASAERFYQRAYDLETLGNRAHGKASALYGLAMTDIAHAKRLKAGYDEDAAQTRLRSAERRLSDSLEIARSENMVFHIFMALVGQAVVLALREDPAGACARIAEAEELFSRRGVATEVIGPETREAIQQTGCPFALRPQRGK